MDNAESIMEEVKVAFLERHVEGVSTVTREEIATFCDDMRQYFILWDDVFAAVHTDDPTVQHCNDTQVKINKAMAQLRKLKMAVTPKAHER